MIFESERAVVAKLGTVACRDCDVAGMAARGKEKVPKLGTEMTKASGYPR